ncbi:MAG: DinB family protein [Bacteroidia bacterium]
MTARPQAGTYAPYFDNYINKVSGDNPLKLLREQILDFKALLSEVPEELENHQYAEGKWTVKEVVGHIIDTERIMCFRALCVARGETISLPGFDENAYVAHSNFRNRDLYDLIHEFGSVREATITLFKSMTEEEFSRQGLANNNPVTPRALLWIIAGHHQHHEAVLRTRYLESIL